MVNRSLFTSIRSLLTRANTRNEAGGLACRYPQKHALAQLAVTGCFSGTFYARAEDQLDRLLELVDGVDDDMFLAKLAVYARERANMKDMPAALLCILSTRDTELTHRIFDRVIDNGRMLRTLFQMVRSGRFGRNGLSSSLRRAFQRWLNEASVGRLLSASIGNDPSLRDVLRMARPTPGDNERRALFGWLAGKDLERWSPACEDDLPEEVRLLKAYRRVESSKSQVAILERLAVRWDLLASDARGPDVWAAIARRMGPQALRMNLNTLVRHDVIGDGQSHHEMVDSIAERLASEDEICRSHQMPYQFLAAYLNADDRLPQKIRSALHRAAEIACGNVPELPGPVVVGLDVSGSMNSPVTGVSHEVQKETSEETRAVVTLKNGPTIANKDFLLEYRLAGTDTTMATLAHRADGEGYFMCVLQPKWNVEPAEITPREVVLLLDVSGSMRGKAISQMRIFAEEVLGSLNPRDTFRILSFTSVTGQDTLDLGRTRDRCIYREDRL